MTREITCPCCGKPMSRVEIVEELADRFEWEAGVEYTVSAGTYGDSETANLRTPGLVDLLERERDRDV